MTTTISTDQWIRLRDMPIPVHGVYGSAFVGGLIWASGGGTSIGGSFGSLYNQVSLQQLVATDPVVCRFMNPAVALWSFRS